MAIRRGLAGALRGLQQGLMGGLQYQQSREAFDYRKLSDARDAMEEAAQRIRTTGGNEADVAQEMTAWKAAYGNIEGVEDADVLETMRGGLLDPEERQAHMEQDPLFATAGDALIRQMARRVGLTDEQLADVPVQITRPLPEGVAGPPEQTPLLDPLGDPTMAPSSVMAQIQQSQKSRQEAMRNAAILSGEMEGQRQSQVALANLAFNEEHLDRKMELEVKALLHLAPVQQQIQLESQAAQGLQERVEFIREMGQRSAACETQFETPDQRAECEDFVFAQYQPLLEERARRQALMQVAVTNRPQFVPQFVQKRDKKTGELVVDPITGRTEHEVVMSVMHVDENGKYTISNCEDWAKTIPDAETLCQGVPWSAYIEQVRGGPPAWTGEAEQRIGASAMLQLILSKRTLDGLPADYWTDDVEGRNAEAEILLQLQREGIPMNTAEQQMDTLAGVMQRQFGTQYIAGETWPKDIDPLLQGLIENRQE
jgi:hypothetical protein